MVRMQNSRCLYANAMKGTTSKCKQWLMNNGLANVSFLFCPVFLTISGTSTFVPELIN
jgi:hypothetical protein